jgi:predicted dehydrogenase
MPFGQGKRPLSLGILGGANIARAFIRDVRPSPAIRLAAVASRNAQNASAFAVANGIERSHASYDALLSDPDIDAVYIPLPNSMHAEWAVKCADAGKHVLCEKPLALDRRQAQVMFDAANRNGVVLLESFPWWYQPQTLAMLAMIADGVIGEVRSVQACCGFMLNDALAKTRLDGALGGGAVFDCGCYPLSLIQLVMGQSPSRVTAMATPSAGGVDMSAMATLEYADGRRAQMSCAMDTASHRHATIVGTGGVIETGYPNHTSDGSGSDSLGYLPGRMQVRKRTAMAVPFETVEIPGGSGFRFAAEALARIVRERDTSAYTAAASASLGVAATMEAIHRSIRSGSTAAVL